MRSKSNNSHLNVLLFTKPLNYKVNRKTFKQIITLLILIVPGFILAQNSADGKYQ